MVQVIQNTQSENTRRRAIESLKKIGVGNPEAVTALVQVIQNTRNQNTRRQAIATLRKIDPGNPHL
ncbi:HEAT repeat domain-containing protein [Limnospira fusiformis KN01]|nr:MULTISPECIES: HEAT repeat domain-containing protein [Limnospira]MDT9199486.1 HEAT repeat domain-containing protein [Limnospira sp. PMC 1042.18]ULB44762.1 HEAT repeat domain-containing protein [Limnospira fusiformis KN01]